MSSEFILSCLHKLPAKNLRETPKYFLLSCPFAEYFHNKKTDNRPSFQISKDDESYYCYSCKCKGPFWDLLDQIKFLENRQDLNEDIKSLLSPKKFVVPSCKTWFKYKENKKVSLPQELLDRFPAAVETKAVDYIRYRNIDLNLAKRYNLRYDEERNRLLFPIYDELNFVGFQGRALEKDENKYYNYFNIEKSHYLGGTNHLTNHRVIIVVEGFISLLKLKYLIPEFNVVTVFGSTLSDEQAIKLINYDKLIISCFDNDEAGNSGRLIFNEKLKYNRHKPKNLTLPEDIDTISKDIFESYLFKVFK